MNNDEEYLLGAMGDAYLDVKRNELQVYQDNVEWLNEINEILYRLFGFRGRIFKRDVFWLRKRDKKMAQRIISLQSQELTDGKSFVAGLFDSEGSVYSATNGSTIVLDITQSEKGLKQLIKAKDAIERVGIKPYINGPYVNKHGKLLQYHLRIYGRENSKKFLEEIPIKHCAKKRKLIFLIGR